MALPSVTSKSSFPANTAAKVLLPEPFTPRNYEFTLFESIGDFLATIQAKEKEMGLSRMIAGYAWPWISKSDPDAHDIEIEDVKLKWNSKNSDWINSLYSASEVGCIHTTQGYDLNYAGIIFGREIGYDKVRGEITIDPGKYFDRNGKQSIKDPAELKQFILNIYKTIMLRGIRGTFVYACDPGLRDYLARYIPRHGLPTATTGNVRGHADDLDQRRNSRNQAPRIIV